MCSFTNNGNYEKKKISNKMYSFTIPSDWEHNNSSDKTENPDTFEPKGRDVGKYWVYYLSWGSPKTKTNFFERINLYIESHKMKDGSQIPVNEADEKLMRGLRTNSYISSIDRKELPCKKSKQKRFTLTTVENAISQTKYVTAKSRSFYLIQESNGITHRVVLSMSEEVSQLPGSEKLAQDIFDSFSFSTLPIASNSD
ncbi:MAG: hypothetical protein LBJ72_02360 [Dysgonamonadaceae bacterium]|nr:hypothetical protein [Dysgonamonadaceae bacterium]